MLVNYGNNFQELWVPKNGQKQPKKAQISQNWENEVKMGWNEVVERILTPQVGKKCYIPMYINVS